MAVITVPTIVPVDFSADAPPFVFLTAPLPHYNTITEISHSFASLKASERPLAPESLYFSDAPLCPLAQNLYSAHPPAPSTLRARTSNPTAPLRTLLIIPFPHLLLSCPDFGLPAPRPRFLPLPVTALCPTISTTPILLSDPPVRPSCLQVSWSQIAPQSLGLPFL